MPNHVHLILTPGTAQGIGRAVGETHRRYTNVFNARGTWAGKLFQIRFACVAMDEAHLMAAVRYVSLNPVRARLVTRAQVWPWSSVRAHLAGVDDELAVVAPVLERVENFGS
jgi:putative transposase